MSDIRLREWMKTNSYVAKVAKLLLETDDILLDLDDYQMHHNQIYPYFEDFELQVSSILRNFIKCIDENQELLLIDKKVDEFYNR